MFMGFFFFTTHTFSHTHIYRTSPRVAVIPPPGSAEGDGQEHVRFTALILSPVWWHSCCRVNTYDTRMHPFLHTVSPSPSLGTHVRHVPDPDEVAGTVVDDMNFMLVKVGPKYKIAGQQSVLMISVTPHLLCSSRYKKLLINISKTTQTWLTDSHYFLY